MTVKVAGVRELRRIEATADQSVMSYAQMMREAGEAAASAFIASELFRQRRRAESLFLIGKGNNGGDGLVMARDLAIRRPTADNPSLPPRGRADAKDKELSGRAGRRVARRAGD